MRIATVIEHNGEPALGIPYTNTDGVLFRVRVKALNTGIILEGFHKAVTGEDPGIIMLPHILKVDEQVACDVHPVRMSDVEEWYGSDECISLLDFLASRDSEGPAPDTDNTSAEDQDHEQDQQDHEPDPEPDVGSNEPDPESDLEISWLTDLQRSVMRCLGIESGSVADIAEKMGRTTNSDKAQIRKTVHELCDMGLILKVGTITQNGRPAMIWGVK